MVKKILIIKLTICLLFLLVSSSIGASNFYQLENINFEKKTGELSLKFDREISGLTFRDIVTRSRGNQVVIFEFLDTISNPPKKNISINYGQIIQATYAQFQNDPQKITRLVVDLKVPLKYEVLKNAGNLLKIKFIDNFGTQAEIDSKKETSASKLLVFKGEESFGNQQKSSEKNTPSKLPTEAEKIAYEGSQDIYARLTPDLKERAKKLISVDLKDADLVTVIRLFSRHTGIDVITEEQVKGKITASFNDIPALEAFDFILKNAGFSWFQKGKVIVVSKERPVRVFKLQYVKVKDVLEPLNKVVSTSTNLSIYPDSNTIMVRGTLADIAKVEEMVKELDVKPLQVLVDAKIIELTESGEAKLGVIFKHAGIAGATEYELETQGLADLPTAEKAAEGFYAHAINEVTGVEAYLSAMQSKKDYNVLASPKILALNNKEAEILIGSRIGYKTTTTSGQVTETSVSFLEVGTKLRFTASVSEDTKTIIMKVHPEVSEGQISNVSGLPTTSTTEVTVEVMVRDGQSLVIGGLVRESLERRDIGVPILSSLPLIGALFRRTENYNQRRELLIFLTPKIIDVEKMPDVTREVKTFEQKRETTKTRKSWILP